MGIEERIDKTISTTKNTMDYIAPYKYVPFNEHLEQIKKYSDVQEIFNETDPKYHKDLENRLMYHLENTRKENRRLRCSLLF